MWCRTFERRLIGSATVSFGLPNAHTHKIMLTMMRIMTIGDVDDDNDCDDDGHEEKNQIK